MKTSWLHLFLVLVGFSVVMHRSHGAEPISVSSAAAADAAGGGNSFGPLLSSDGRRLVFLSHAQNLATNQIIGQALQIFVRDLSASNTTLVSVGSNGQSGDANSVAPAISTDGRYIAFASEAGNLVANDTNYASDVFVRDLATQVTRAVSVDQFGRLPAETSTNTSVPLSGYPLISAEGRFVFFESRSGNLGFGLDTNNAVDVFRRDVWSNETALLTVKFGTAGPEAANAGSALASISSDGRHVVLISRATDLVPGVSNSLGDVYVRDMESNTMILASSPLNHALGYRVAAASISEDGRFVAFSVQSDGAPSELYLRDLQAPAPVLITSNITSLSAIHMSGDGRFVIYEDGANVFRFDANTASHQLVNVTTTGESPTVGTARQPTMTQDGNGIVFISNMPGLVTNSSGLFQVYARDMNAGVTRLVSANTNGEPSSSDHEMSLVDVATDLSIIAFDTAASDLVGGDGNRAHDVFLRNTTNETTVFISGRQAGRLRRLGLGDVQLDFESGSADGRFIAFTSYDTDIVPGDTNGLADLFVFDIASNSVVTAEFSTNRAASPSMSAQGRYIAYVRRGHPNPPSRAMGGDVYRFDRLTGQSALIAQGSGSTKPAISPDGRFIAFVHSDSIMLHDVDQGTNANLGSFLPSLDPDAAFTRDGRFLLFRRPHSNGEHKLYAFDLLHGTTQTVSRVQNVDVGVLPSGIAISGNSRFVVFSSGSSPGLYRYDLIERTNHFLHPDGVRPAVSDDGKIVVARTRIADGSLFGLEVETGVVFPVAEANRERTQPPIISGDGRFVVFPEGHLTQIAGRVSYSAQLYVRDRLLGTTTLVSRGTTGTNANALVRKAVLAADGQTVLFQSLATDLTEGDYNDKRDLFVLKLGGADTDGDGMDDDWEQVYFEGLVRDGFADFDDDGVSDRAEFLAGTDPTDTGSLFRVLTVTPLSGGNTRLVWVGNSNRSYRAEYKDRAENTVWSSLNGPISWDNGTASTVDTSATNNAQRFYRVVRLP